jgi:hypothetical protein
VKIVTAGRGEPSLDRSWRFCAEVRRLSPFNLDNILLYLDRRGVRKNDQSVLAQALEMFTRGNTGELANLVDSWLLKQEAQTAQ